MFYDEVKEATPEVCEAPMPTVCDAINMARGSLAEAVVKLNVINRCVSGADGFEQKQTPPDSLSTAAMQVLELSGVVAAMLDRVITSLGVTR